MDYFNLVFIVITVIIVTTFINIAIFLLIYNKSIHNYDKKYNDYIKKSRSIIKGQVGEQLLPFFKDFEYNSKDMCFLGKPVDYVVFNGLNREDVDSITFLEIKSGKSRLTKTEKQIKEAVKNKKIYWDEYKIDK